MIRLCLVDKSMNSFTVSNRIEWNNIVIWFYLGTDVYWVISLLKFCTCICFFLAVECIPKYLFKEEKLEEAMQQYEMVSPFNIFFFGILKSFFHPFFFFFDKFKWLVLISGHCIFGRWFHVPTVWQVSRYGIGS